ncbi:MAG: hypothetical protein ACQEVA_14805 [Myxococcota bacterium]
MDDEPKEREDEPPEVQEVRRATAETRGKQAAMLGGGAVLAVAVFVAMWVETEALTDIGSGLKADVTVGMTWGALITGLTLALFGLSLFVHATISLRS